MAPRVGGDKVKAGFYWNPTEWEMVTISGESGGTLPGSPDIRFYRVPALAMLAAAPIMGALFVIFLPFIGIALFLHHLGRQSVAATRRSAHAFMATVSPRLRHEGAEALDKKVEEREGDER